MKSNTLARRWWVSLVWPAALRAPVVAAGLWWRFGHGSLPEVAGVAGLALAAVLGAAWLLRARAARRWRAAMNTYAEREIARARPRKVSRAV